MEWIGEALSGRSGHAAAWQLLERLYTQTTGEAMPRVVRSPGGKPCFVDSPWHFSLTHTKNYAFAVLHTAPVGIDAEELGRRVSEALPERVLSPAEYGQYEAAPDKSRAFITLWVLKEAAAKCGGKGIQYPENQTNFQLNDPRVREHLGCLVAIVTEESNAV